MAGGILLGGLGSVALGTAAPAGAAPVGTPDSMCFTTGSPNATPNAAGPLTRPALVGTIEPSTGVYAAPRACFGN